MQLPGTLIEGKYEIIAKIREGGMGTIYKVRHRLLDEVRVIKVMKPQVVADEDLKRRFVDEAKTATRLKHPNICTIHDFAIDDDGTAYLVMEFIDGANLADLLQSRGSPGVALTLQVAHQSLLALGYLHRRNVVHRDVAPDNLMMTHDEEGQPRVKLIDLGIAKALDRTGAEQTSTGVFLGKLKYASPEQYGALPAGERIDGRSDLYCLGVVLYELLTGTRPFVGETPAELLRAHLFAAPLSFEETDPRGVIPPEVRQLLLKALEKKREDRFQTADEFDREVVGLMSRFGGTDLRHTAQLLSTVRSTPDDADGAVTVTPSAQGRLDRQFGAQATPQPSRPKLVSVPPGGEPSTPSSAPRPSAEKTRIAPGRPRPLAGVLLLLLVAAAGALLWSRRPLPRRTEPVPSAATPARELPARAVPGAVTSREAEPTAQPSPEPTEEARPTAPAPSPAAPREKSPQEPAADRAAAEQARLRASRARAGAERAAAADKASGLFEFGRRAEDEGDRLFARRNFPAARAAFEKSAESFASAQTEALQAVQRKPPPAPTAALVAAPRPEPTRVAVVARTEAPPPPISPAGPSKAGSPEQERIREVLRDYERAHNTLDVELYGRVFPSFVAQQRQNLDRAWQGLKSQHLEVEIRQIEVNGSQASVRAHQRLVVVPQAGIEQRDSRDVVFRMEKRGDSWVIAARN